MPLTISRTSSFRRLQNKIGSATYRLNTILVGLEFIADGGEKPARLAVTWKKPPEDKAREVANQAQIFACAGAMALAGDVFDQFLRDVSRERWLKFGNQAIGIATKSVRRTDEQGGDYSVAERTAAISADLKIQIGPLLAGIELFAKWRNIVVHTDKRVRSLDPDLERVLLQEAQFFHDHFSHLDIKLALKNFRDRKTPVPKEATSLIAMIQQVSRRINDEAIKRVAATPYFMDQSVDNMLTAYFQEPLRTKPLKTEIAEIWYGSYATRRGRFLKLLRQLGIDDLKEPVSAPVTENYLAEILQLSPEEAFKKFAPA